MPKPKPSKPIRRRAPATPANPAEQQIAAMRRQVKLRKTIQTLSRQLSKAADRADKALGALVFDLAAYGDLVAVSRHVYDADQRTIAALRAKISAIENGLPDGATGAAAPAAEYEPVET